MYTQLTGHGWVLHVQEKMAIGSDSTMERLPLKPPKWLCLTCRRLTSGGHTVNRGGTR
jgi:hypothetical protein